MYPNNDQIPLNLDAFTGLEGVVDVVYNPVRTNLVQRAQALGKKAEGGLYMLGSQAVFASEHFFGKHFDISLLDKVYSAVLSSTTSSLRLVARPARD